MDLSAIITAVVAVYGAGLSTYILIRNYREKRRQLTVTLSHGWPIYGNNLGKTHMLYIIVANPGNRTVTINPPYIKLPDDPPIFFPKPKSDVTFPYELKEGKNCRIWLGIEGLRHDLIKNGYSGTVKLTAKVEDGAENVYSSKKPFKLNLEEKE